MDDIYEYKCADDDSGLRVRSCIWESSQIPAGFVKWSIERYEPELGAWLTVERSDNAWTLDVALEVTRERLKWWAENFILPRGS